MVLQFSGTKVKHLGHQNLHRREMDMYLKEVRSSNTARRNKHNTAQLSTV